MREHTKGLLIALADVLLLTPDALLIRLVGADAWTLLFWRGVGFFITIGSWSLWRSRGRARAAVAEAGAAGVAVALLFAISSGEFLWSIGHTRAANTLVIVAISPLFAAGWSFVLLSERPRRDTLLATSAPLSASASRSLARSAVAGSRVTLRPCSQPSSWHSILPSCGACAGASSCRPMSSPACSWRHSVPWRQTV